MKNAKVETVEVVFRHDEHPENPREYCNLGILFAYHSRYTIEGEYDRENHFKLNQALEESRLVSRKEYVPEAERSAYDNYAPYELYELACKATDTIAAILPVYIYDHGGIAINTTGFMCPWDSGQIGFIIATRQDVLEAYGKKRLTKKLREQAKQMLELEVEQLHKYAAGELFMCIIESPDGEITAYGEIESVDHFVDILNEYVGEDYKIVVKFKEHWEWELYADDIEALAEKRGLSVTIEEPRDSASCF